MPSGLRVAGVRPRLMSVAVLVAALVVVAGPAPVIEPVSQAHAVTRPNIVVIMTDDQTLESLRVMPNTRALVGDQGTTFTNAFATYPECCPSRATFLTGQYAHNHGVASSALPTGGVTKLRADNTLPVWLDTAGYWTSFTGKYLNGYGKDSPADVPPGWDSWWGLVDPSTYQVYGYTINKDGVLATQGSTEADYQTDVLGQHVVDVIRARDGQADPFFIWFNPVAPHHVTNSGTGAGYPLPAPRHKGTLTGQQVPRNAGFNEADVADKPAHIRALPALTAQNEINRDTFYRMELEMLLSVDEWVAEIFEALDDTGALDDTIVVFTSDNGFLHGEHRILSGKVHPYEQAIRVPLLVRGPGFPAGATRSQMVGNIDLAPTLTLAAGATPGLTADGVALQPFAQSATAGPNRSMLITVGPGGGRRTWAGIRGNRFKYVEHSTGEKELYDLVADPHEISNKAGNPGWATIEQRMASRLAVLRACRGTGCAVQ